MKSLYCPTCGEKLAGSKKVFLSESKAEWYEAIICSCGTELITSYIHHGVRARIFVVKAGSVGNNTFCPTCGRQIDENINDKKFIWNSWYTESSCRCKTEITAYYNMAMERTELAINELSVLRKKGDFHE